MPNASIRDVAACAGVSTATVSHVINNTRHVSEETRRAVLRAIESLNYNPNAMARILRTGRKGIVGFVVPDIRNPFFSTLAEEVEGVLGQENCRLLLSNSREDSTRELENMRMMASGIVDGVLVASTLQNYEEVHGIVPEDFPMVFLDRAVPGCPCDTVRVNTYDAVAQATEALIQNGHTRIACFENSYYLSSTVERISAYKAVMGRHGLEPFSITKPVIFADITPSLEKMLANHITALITTDGFTSIACAEYFTQRGLIFGKDIDMLAFQDDEMPHFFYSFVAAVCQPVRELGRVAAQRLLQRIAEPGLPAREIVFQASYLPKGQADSPLYQP